MQQSDIVIVFGAFVALGILVAFVAYALKVSERYAQQRESAYKAWRERISRRWKVHQPPKQNGAKLAPDVFRPIDPRD